MPARAAMSIDLPVPKRPISSGGRAAAASTPAAVVPPPADAAASPPPMELPRLDGNDATPASASRPARRSLDAYSKEDLLDLPTPVGPVPRELPEQLTPLRVRISDLSSPDGRRRTSTRWPSFGSPHTAASSKAQTTAPLPVAPTPPDAVPLSGYELAERPTIELTVRPASTPASTAPSIDPTRPPAGRLPSPPPGPQPGPQPAPQPAPPVAAEPPAAPAPAPIKEIAAVAGSAAPPPPAALPTAAAAQDAARAETTSKLPVPKVLSEPAGYHERGGILPTPDRPVDVLFDTSANSGDLPAESARATRGADSGLPSSEPRSSRPSDITEPPPLESTVTLEPRPLRLGRVIAALAVAAVLLMLWILHHTGYFHRLGHPDAATPPLTSSPQRPVPASFRGGPCK